jgi:hypothetical protein
MSRARVGKISRAAARYNWAAGPPGLSLPEHGSCRRLESKIEMDSIPEALLTNYCLFKHLERC